MFQLYLKFLIPLAILGYLLKTNPFYKSYPAMMPIMATTSMLILIGMVRYSRNTNRMVR